jgi:hypothetical protein
MKVFGLAAICLLISSSEAIKIKFSDFPIEENAEMLSENTKMEKEPTNIMTEIDQKISQAERNANQGELGRTLAMNKINEIKLHLGQL